MKIIAILLTLLLGSPILAQEYEDEIISSKAKEMRIDAFYAFLDSSTNKVVQGERMSGYKSRTYIKYTKKGAVAERYYDYNEGTFYLAYISTFKNRLLDTTTTHIRVLDPPTSWTVYEYDKKNRETSVRHIEDDLREGSKVETTYNSDGKISQTKSYYWGEVDVITTYTYDSKGNKTEEVHSYPNEDNAETKSVFTYDSNGNMLSDAYQDTKGVWTVSCAYKYNDQNLCIEKCVSKKSEPCKVNGEWTYDEHGNVIAQKILSNYGTPDEYWRNHRMEYEYDSKGNWTKKTVFYEDAPVKIVIRTIAY